MSGEVTRAMTRERIEGHLPGLLVVTGCILWLLSVSAHASSYDSFDVVSGVMQAPRFRDVPPLQRLRLAADLISSKKLKDSDMSFAILDWGDQYLREPPDPFDRLKRWLDLVNDDQLSGLKLPRDFLNRMLVSEYLVEKTKYLRSTPNEKLVLLRDLTNQKVLDWSVALAYSRIYAGVVISGSKGDSRISPAEALRTLKKLKDDGLVEWHYRVPTEAVLCSEVLAMDKQFRAAAPKEKLAKLRDLEEQGLITELTRKELEKIPVWRLLTDDEVFLRASPESRRKKIQELRSLKLVSQSTCTDLLGIFRPRGSEPAPDFVPVPLPEPFQPKSK